MRGATAPCWQLPEHSRLMSKKTAQAGRASSLPPLGATPRSPLGGWLPPGPWDWPHPGSARGQLAGRAGTGSTEMRGGQGDGEQRDRARQPPPENNHHSSSTDTRLHGTQRDSHTLNVTSNPNHLKGMTGQRRVSCHFADEKGRGPGSCDPHPYHTARWELRPPTRGLPSWPRTLTDNIKQLFLGPCDRSQNICHHESSS